MHKIINEVATNMPTAVLCHIMSLQGIAMLNYDEGKARCPEGVYWSHDDIMGLVTHHIKGLSKEQVCAIFPYTTYYIVTVSNIMCEGEEVVPCSKCYVYRDEDIGDTDDVEDFLAHAVNDKIKELVESDDYNYDLNIESYTPSTVQSEK